MQAKNKKQNTEYTDAELIDSIKRKEDSNALVILTDRHAPLYASTITKLARKFNNWNNVSELLGEKYFVAYNAALRFDPGRNTKFSTFLANEAKWAYLNRCNKQKRISKQVHVQDQFLEKLGTVESNPQKDLVERDTLVFIFKALSLHPDKRIKKIFTMRYKTGKGNKVMPWHEVGGRVGLSAQGCINIHSTGIQFIKEKLKKEGIKSC
jgi:DNA-directed RNA polymerase specialized sigma subunit